MERRRQERLKVLDMVFAVLKNRARKLGKIVDISRGGLAFCYADDDQLPSQASELEILFSRTACYLERIPVRVVSDFEMPKEVPFSTVTMRRCGVAFGQLTPEQVSQLDCFVADHATNMA